MFVPLSNPRNWPCPLTGPVGLGLEDETSAECAAHKNEGAQDRALSSPVLFLSVDEQDKAALFWAWLDCSGSC